MIQHLSITGTKPICGTTRKGVVVTGVAKKFFMEVVNNDSKNACKKCQAKMEAE